MYNAGDFLNKLNGSILKHAIKSSDLDLYDFCFYSPLLNEHLFIHATCRFKIINMIHKQSVNCFYENTSSELFCDAIEDSIGMEIIRIALSSKNDLWIDLGDCRIVFVTFEDNEESWRLFSSNEEQHLVASSESILFC